MSDTMPTRPGVLPDHWIRKLALTQRMIEPFVDQQVREGVISYGLSSYGYDARVADEFRVFAPAGDGVLDPKRPDAGWFRAESGTSCIIPPHSFVLARTVEYFRIPRGVITICYGKSTYARSGVLVNVTPFEPEWEGFATMQIVNTSPLPVRIHAGEGIAQILFLAGADLCERSYADKRGKYQAQAEVTLPRID